MSSWQKPLSSKRYATNSSVRSRVLTEHPFLTVLTPVWHERPIDGLRLRNGPLTLQHCEYRYTALSVMMGHPRRFCIAEKQPVFSQYPMNLPAATSMPRAGIVQRIKGDTARRSGYIDELRRRLSACF